MLKNFAFPAECLLRASHFADQKESRGFLRHIRLDAGVLIATNGHYLFCEKLPEYQAMKIIEPQSIPLDKVLLAYCKAGKREPELRYLVGIHDNHGKLSLYVTIASNPVDAMNQAEEKRDLLFSWHTDCPDNDYPDWRKVFPRWDSFHDPNELHSVPTMKFGFDPSYMALFAKVSDCVRVIPPKVQKEGGAMLIQFANKPQCCALLMPKRISDDWTRYFDFVGNADKLEPETVASAA